MFKTDDQVRDGIKRGLKWVDRWKGVELASTSVDENGVLRHVFLVKLRLNSPRFSTVQLGSSVLSNSKRILAEGYHLLTKLFRQTGFRVAYTDTGGWRSVAQ